VFIHLYEKFAPALFYTVCVAAEIKQRNSLCPINGLRWVKLIQDL